MIVEQKNVIVLLIGLLLGGAMGGLVSSYCVQNVAHADPSTGIIKARLIQLVDENGMPRASLGFSEDKHPVLAFLDQGGKVATHFGQTSHGGVLEFKDGAGRARMMLSLDSQELPGIYLLEGVKNLRASLFIDSGNSPMLALADSNGKPCLMAGLEKDSEPALILKNRAGGNQSALYSHPRLGPGLFLMDSRDKANKAYTTKGIVDADDAGGKELGERMLR
jgi:hypothetical protein